MEIFFNIFLLIRKALALSNNENFFWWKRKLKPIKNNDILSIESIEYINLITKNNYNSNKKSNTYYYYNNQNSQSMHNINIINFTESKTILWGIISPTKM